MRLIRVQIPKFRVLQDIDITFEKEFFPPIFPLGSQNGGGKSTLLQLIFALLHCPGDEKRLPYLKNILTGFEKHTESVQQLIARFEVWHNERQYMLEFFSCHDRYLQQSLGVQGEEYSFLALPDLQALESTLARNRKSISIIEALYERFKDFKKLERSDQQEELIANELKTYREKSGILQAEIGNIAESIGIDRQTLHNGNVLAGQSLLIFDKLPRVFEQKLQQGQKTLLELEERKTLLSQTAQEISERLHAQNLLYITNFSPKHGKNDKEALLCRVEGLDSTQIAEVLHDISEKIFLAAPSTQVYLLLPEAARKLLFKTAQSVSTYRSQLAQVQTVLPGFFTYDVISVDAIIRSFTTARDEDFRQAVESEGQYGDHYETLLEEFSVLLRSKKIRPNAKLSEIVFQSDINGHQEELFPEDLSHGELKRVSIYAWIKSKGIHDAVILMDEIENALHPDWQYQIMADLERWSPGTQYILATHSYELCQAVTPAHVKELEPKLLKPATELR